MSVRITTEPTVEPVTLAEFKDWARIDEATADDAVCTLLIKAMRSYAENLTGRAFVQRTLQLVQECWGEAIVLPHPPLVSVSSITYVDEDGTVQTLAANQYVVHDYREPGLIVPAWQVTWPAHRAVLDAIRVNYVAGYPSGSPVDYRENVPAALKLWMQARAATLFEMREQIQMGAYTWAEIPRAYVDGLLDELVTADRIV